MAFGNCTVLISGIPGGIGPSLGPLLEPGAIAGVGVPTAGAEPTVEIAAVGDRDPCSVGDSTTGGRTSPVGAPGGGVFRTDAKRCCSDFSPLLDVSLPSLDVRGFVDDEFAALEEATVLEVALG